MNKKDDSTFRKIRKLLSWPLLLLVSLFCFGFAWSALLSIYGIHLSGDFNQGIMMFIVNGLLALVLGFGVRALWRFVKPTHRPH